MVPMGFCPKLWPTFQNWSLWYPKFRNGPGSALCTYGSHYHSARQRMITFPFECGRSCTTSVSHALLIHPGSSLSKSRTKHCILLYLHDVSGLNVSWDRNTGSVSEMQYLKFQLSDAGLQLISPAPNHTVQLYIVSMFNNPRAFWGTKGEPIYFVSRYLKLYLCQILNAIKMSVAVSLLEGALIAGTWRPIRMRSLENVQVWNRFRHNVIIRSITQMEPTTNLGVISKQISSNRRTKN